MGETTVAPNITIYTTPTCPYCRQEKQFLREHGMSFRDIDVAADHDQAHIMIEKSGQMGVPVTVITQGGHEQVLIGFDEQRLTTILKLA